MLLITRNVLQHQKRGTNMVKSGDNTLRFFLTIFPKSPVANVTAQKNSLI